MTRHRLAPPSVLAALVLIAGCADSQRTAGPEPSPDDFTDPAEFLQAHADALHDRDLDRYAALLASDFEFEPTSDDLLDLPWITPASPWSRALELIAIGNMMNPEFTSSVTVSTSRPST
jgi:hypothetical protein